MLFLFSLIQEDGMYHNSKYTRRQHQSNGQAVGHHSPLNNKKGPSLSLTRRTLLGIIKTERALLQLVTVSPG